MYTKEEVFKAKKRVKAKKAFFQHLMSYAIINLFLLVLNLLTSPGYLWFVFPLLGWGVGLAFHYVDVFGIPGFDILSKEWEERELERELGQSGQHNSGNENTGFDEQKPKKGLELKELRRNYDDTDFV